jgi:hypothetical protein
MATGQTKYMLYYQNKKMLLCIWVLSASHVYMFLSSFLATDFIDKAITEFRLRIYIYLPKLQVLSLNLDLSKYVEMMILNELMDRKLSYVNIQCQFA